MINLNALVEFDCPFTIKGREIDDAPSSVYSPQVWHVDAPHPNDIEIEDSSWEAYSVGYTQQFLYKGAVMHQSEILAGKLASDILNNDGTYVITSVDVMADHEDDDPFPAGWVVLRLKD